MMDLFSRGVGFGDKAGLLGFGGVLSALSVTLGIRLGRMVL